MESSEGIDSSDREFRKHRWSSRLSMFLIRSLGAPNVAVTTTTTHDMETFFGSCAVAGVPVRDLHRDYSRRELSTLS